MAFLLICCACLSYFSSLNAQQNRPQQTVSQRLAEDLTWAAAEREQRFANMGAIFPGNTIQHPPSRELNRGTPLRLQQATSDALHDRMQRDRLAGVLVLQHGTIRLERYALGATAGTAWTSFSVTKSITSTLVGYALRDGFLRSAEDSVTLYLPELTGSAYEGVTIRQLADMTSGVHWVEDYTAPDSDNVRLYQSTVLPGHDQVIEYMRRLRRDARPGSKFVYKTGETDLLGVLVRRAVGMSLSAYAQQRLWREMGAEADGFWIADMGSEFGGSGLSATLRDFGRFGEFVRTHLDRASALDAWLAEATRGQADDGRYGLGWWTYPDGSFAALGIFGQSVLVDPRRELVVVTIGAWPQATSPALVADRAALWDAVRAAVDRER